MWIRDLVRRTQHGLRRGVGLVCLRFNLNSCVHTLVGHVCASYTRTLSGLDVPSLSCEHPSLCDWIRRCIASVRTRQALPQGSLQEVWHRGAPALLFTATLLCVHNSLCAAPHGINSVCTAPSNSMQLALSQQTHT